MLFISCSITVVAQTKEFVAVKADVAPKIDGVLSDAAWNATPPITSFIQSFPTFGLPASTKTEVKILYDNNAVYVSAYLYDDPSNIRRQLTVRDDEERKDVDYFAVFFDTYNDQQNGFQFLVTSANVQTDAKLSGNKLDDADRAWDAVWQSKVAYRNDGWIVEMRIPYSSLRFSKKEIQTWGLQFLRSTRRNNELAYWNPVDPKIDGFINQFGKYSNLQNIQPPLRLSFAPYLAGGIRFNPEGSRQSTEVVGSGGMDVKYGINESFTLDATLIPDFGQVISDNVVNNLSPFEQQFQENRSFFTEGTELFNKSGLFYSRRIGAPPSGYGRTEALYGNENSGYDIKKNPAVTKLYNAIKLSGRTEKKLGIGFFNAVTAPMYAQLQNRYSGFDSSIQTEPTTNYNIFVLDKAFAGRSSVTFTNTNVIRSGAAQDANVSALDWALYNQKSTHAFSGTARYSKTFGYRPYRGSYFFNTDTVTLAGRRYLNPYDGFAGRLRFAKVGGKIRYGMQVNIESATYDANDLGYLQAPNEVVYSGNISYNQLQPTDKFITYNYGLSVRQQYLFKPYAYSQTLIQANAFWVFKNFWDVRVNAVSQPIWQTDFFDLQTKGYQVKKPSFYQFSVEGSTDSRKKFFSNYEFLVGKTAIKNSDYYTTLLGFRYRFSNRFTANVEFERQHDKLEAGWTFLRELNGAPIVGYRNTKDINSVLSATYNFTSRMNFSVRSRHYWSGVKYLSFYNVDAKGNHIPRDFIDDEDQNFNLFNVDAFFTWDFRYGSRIIAGWKNFLGTNFSDNIDGIRYANYSKNLGQTFDLPHGNELTLRVIYFLDYNQLRRKR